MADERVVLSDALGFLRSKFGKTGTKSLRAALSDFYSGEELSVAINKVKNCIVPSAEIYMLCKEIIFQTVEKLQGISCDGMIVQRRWPFTIPVLY